MKQKVTIQKLFPVQTGEKKDGTGMWKSRDAILKADDGAMYSDLFVVSIRGDKCEDGSLVEGGTYWAEISFGTREYNGKVYEELWLRNLKSLTPDASPLGEGDDEPF